jgi:hypothetical protein
LKTLNPTKNIMTTLLIFCLAIWLAKGIAQILIGLAQILFGSAAMLAAVALYFLAHATEAFSDLWMTAFPTSNN